VAYIYEELLFKIYAGDVGFDTATRPISWRSWLNFWILEWWNFKSVLTSIDNQKLLLPFRDGTTAEADLGEHEEPPFCVKAAV
jgi:hypothetical protein